MKALTYCKIKDGIDPTQICTRLDCREYVEEIIKRKSRASINESCAALFLLAKTLEDEFNEDTSILKYKKDEHGCPYFENREDISFSLSHSGEYAVCAVTTEGGVGVDIEKTPTDEKRERTEKIKERFFSEKEKSRAEKSGKGFATVWTRKEAYYKYNGGRSHELDSENDKSVAYDSFEIAEKYIVTVCRDIKSEAFSEPREIKSGIF